MYSKAADYYRSGEYNCSQCILKAAKEIYDINITDEQIKSCSAVNNGFGTGGMCCVLIAAMMVFGMLFEEDVARKLRLCLLSEFHSKYGNINCGRMKGYSASGKGCVDVIDNIWSIMVCLIDSMSK